MLDRNGEGRDGDRERSRKGMEAIHSSSTLDKPISSNLKNLMNLNVTTGVESTMNESGEGYAMSGTNMNRGEGNHVRNENDLKREACLDNADHVIKYARSNKKGANKENGSLIAANLMQSVQSECGEKLQEGKSFTPQSDRKKKVNAQTSRLSLNPFTHSAAKQRRLCQLEATKGSTRQSLSSIVAEEAPNGYVGQEIVEMLSSKDIAEITHQISDHPIEATTNYKADADTIERDLSVKEQLMELSKSLAENQNEKELGPIPFQVFLRIRPTFNGRLESALQVVGEKKVRLGSSVGFSDSLSRCSSSKSLNAVNEQPGPMNEYTFDRVFDSETTQRMIYESTARALVHRLLDNQNSLLFAFGITNSGKTHTIQGKSDAQSAEQAGILPRALSNVFYSLQNPGLACDYESIENLLVGFFERNKLKACSSMDTRVLLSYVEVYDEKLIDLFGDPNDAASLRILTKEDGSIFINGLFEIEVATLNDALVLMSFGHQNRAVATTALNAGSSRSHSLFTIKLIKQNVQSKLCIVDLAGSERQLRTNSEGLRLKEAARINQSLMNLGRCLNALRANQMTAHRTKPNSSQLMVTPNKMRRASISTPISPSSVQKTSKNIVIPFRDSKLTHLLQDYLQGYGKTVMLMTASSEVDDFEEVGHALKYAAIASQLMVRPSQKQLLLEKKAAELEKAKNQKVNESYDEASALSKRRVDLADTRELGIQTDDEPKYKKPKKQVNMVNASLLSENFNCNIEELVALRSSNTRLSLLVQTLEKQILEKSRMHTHIQAMFDADFAALMIENQALRAKNEQLESKLALDS